MTDRKEQVRQIVERHFMEMAYNLEAIGAVLPREAWVEARRIVNRLIGTASGEHAATSPPSFWQTMDEDSIAAQQRIRDVG